jgi:uncharacterized damage-inducible protein DinB
MRTETLQSIFNRDLNKLKVEIEAYQNEKNLWLIDKAISNSAGNLCLHLIGNLNAFIGAVLGGTNYVRQRELEFSTKDVAREQLLKMLDDTIVVVETSLSKLSAESLDNEYPMQVFGKPMTTEYFLIHLTTHLTYHLGQINYHRRLMDV